MPSPKPYTGPVVYIVHPMIGWDANNERVRKQAKYHLEKTRKLLEFAKKHDLPVLCEPLAGSDTLELKKLASEVGIKKERFIGVSRDLRDALLLAKRFNFRAAKKEQVAEFSRRISEPAPPLNPTRIIFGGAYRGVCVSSAITDMRWLWPNAKMILLKSGYSVKESKDWHAFPKWQLAVPDRAATFLEMKREGVIFTSKLGEHLLNSAWPLPARQREAKPSAARKRPPVIPRRSLRGASHRI